MTAGQLRTLPRTGLQPNLLQTSRGRPAQVHAGPFGNLSLESSSVLADLIALSHLDGGLARSVGTQEAEDLTLLNDRSRCSRATTVPKCFVSPSVRIAGTAMSTSLKVR